MTKRKPSDGWPVADPGELVERIRQRMDQIQLSRYALARAYAEKHGGQFASHDSRLRRMLREDSSPDLRFMMRVCDIIGMQVSVRWIQ